MEYRIIPAGNAAHTKASASQQFNSLIQQNTNRGWKYLRTEPFSCGNMENYCPDKDRQPQDAGERRMLVFIK